MTTPNIVPRGNGEGGIGTNEKFWKNGYFENLYTHDGAVPTEKHVQLSIKNHNDDIDAHSAAISKHNSAAIGKHNSAASVHTANLASKAEAEAGINTSKFMTPARVSDAIKNFAGADLTGMIFAFAGNTIPSGYLACNGAAISRTTYADLFAVIGTTYGSGDGSTTFNLPNFENNSFMEFSGTVGKAKKAGLPNIQGSMHGLFSTDDISETFYTGAFESGKAGTQRMGTAGAVIDCQVYFNAARISNVYSNDINTVQPKSVTVRAIIKY